MKHRLSRIYTRSGDQGTTGLADGSRVDKDSLRVEAIGAVDELNSTIGLVIAQMPDRTRAALLTTVQQQLFDLGGELALPGAEVIGDRQTTTLEQAIDAINEALPPLTEFVLPGGTPTAANAHVARAVCRRAERTLWRLTRAETVNPASLRYLNRLSDLLFVIARELARSKGPETTWEHDPLEDWVGDSGGE